MGGLVDHIVMMDSANRDAELHPYPNEFRVYFVRPLEDVSRCEVISAIVPNVRYNVTQENNAFAWEEMVGSALSSRSSRIPTGHYSTGDMAVVLQSTMNGLSAAPSQYPTYKAVHPYVVDYSPQTRSFVFETNDDSITQFRLLFSGIEDSCHALLGFDAADTIWNVQSGSRLTSTVHVGLLVQETYVLLSIAEFDRTLQLTGPSRDSDISKEVEFFAKIPLETDSGTMVYFHAPNSLSTSVMSREFKPPLGSLSSILVRWKNQDGSPLNTLIDNSLVLRFWTRTIA
jgi:hypothetical protein